MPELNPATTGSPYRVPPEPSRWPAILLAVAVHALLLGFLWFGINWQNNEPVAVEAEVWDMKTQQAAPPAPPPQQAEPEPQPEPAPAPAPKVAEPPPPPKEVEQPVEKPVTPPDIALEREKKRKEEQLKKRELAEQQEREQAKQKEMARKEEAERKKAETLARKEADRKAQELAEKKEADRKARELAEKKEADRKAEELAEKAAEKKEAEKKAKAEKLAKAKAEAAEKAKLAQLREADMKRMMAAAAGSGGSGTAAKSTAPRMDSGYQAAIAGKVKSNTNYSGSTDAPGNPRAEFQIDQLPTGEILSVRKTKSSGIPAFDDAVEKGIIKSSPLPKKKDGTVERSFPLVFKLKDLE